MERTRGRVKALLVYPEFPETYWAFGTRSPKRVVVACHACGEKVVAGEPYISTRSKGSPTAAHIIIGEIEEPLPELLHDLGSWRH